MKPGGTATWTGAAMLVAGALTYLYFAAQPEGSSRTDDSADRTAQCLTRHPMPENAAGFAKRELDNHGECGGWDVIEYTDVGNRPADLEKPTVRLVIRVHHEESSGSWIRGNAVTACYRMEFDHHGVDNGLARVDCPPGAPALAPPGIQLGHPESYPADFRTILAALPPAPTRDDVLEVFRTKLALEPSLDAAVESGDIAITAHRDRDCLAGVRLADGTVDVWEPDRSNTPPGATGCGAESALRYKRAPK